MWPDGLTNFGLKNILGIECAYPEERVPFGLVLYMHTHTCKNEDECSQIWSGLTNYALYQELKERKKDKKIIII